MGINLSRTVFQDLLAWAKRDGRKPLILRGARQVGKSTSVQILAEALGLELVTLNFERFPALSNLFLSNDPQAITQLISLQVGQSIQPGKSLLFLDEIQAAPQLLATLRYFYEELPKLHLICAGSLLEFALESPQFSMPVGRIEYMYLGPLTFEEFLTAIGEQPLHDFLKKYQLKEDYPEIIHEKFMRLLKTYLIVGGMPEAVKVYALNKDFMDVERIKNTIIATYQDDFSKYAKRGEENRLREVFEKIGRSIACKVQYSKLNPNVKSKLIADALNKLALARVIHLIHHSSCNGIPLGAEINEKIFKPLFLDAGLLSTQLQLSFLDLANVDELIFANSGAITEQFIGQHLLYDQPSYEKPKLYYWQREKKSSQAEIDYVISQQQMIIPIEVKSGKTGTLRSLHLFLQEKQSPLGVRFSTQAPSITEKNNQENYRILSLPLYMVGQVRRLIDSNLPSFRS